MLEFPFSLIVFMGINVNGVIVMMAAMNRRFKGRVPLNRSAGPRGVASLVPDLDEKSRGFRGMIVAKYLF